MVREHIIRALDQAFHPTCFTCVTCARCIGDESFALDSQNEVYCLDDFYRYKRGPCTAWGTEDRVGLRRDGGVEPECWGLGQSWPAESRTACSTYPVFDLAPACS